MDEPRRAFMISLAKGLLLAGLLAHLVLKGVIPAFSAITDDFPTYFTAATIAHHGGDDVTKLYDADWFRAQTLSHKVGSQQYPGAFRPYPPPTALLLMPLTGFQPLTALRVVTVLNLLWLICAVLLLTRIFGWPIVDSALFILLAGWGLRSGLRLGHPYILMSTLCLLGYHLHRKRMPWLAGLALGILAPVKYFSVIVLAAFAVYRQWRVVLGGAIAIAMVGLVSIGVLGWKIHEIFLLDILFNHLTAHIDPEPPFTAIFQSFDSLFTRLFVFDAALNPHPMVVAPQLVMIAIVSTKSLLLLVAAAAVIKLARAAATNALAPTIGVLGVLVFVIAPASATYSLVLLWLPVALLIDYFLSHGARVPAGLILGIYVLIGWIPYPLTYPFEGRGGLTVLAYPRLFLVLAMFGVIVYAVFRTRPVEQASVPLVARA